jgi:hypothetical protein
MFWRYAEICLNRDRLRTVQSRINLGVTLNEIHHVRARSFSPLLRRGDGRLPE